MSSLFKEIWREFRPYLIVIFSDLLVALSLWLVLFIFKQFTALLPIENKVIADMISEIHSVGTILAFAVFGILFFIDVYQIRKNEKDKKLDR